MGSGSGPGVGVAVGWGAGTVGTVATSGCVWVRGGSEAEPPQAAVRSDVSSKATSASALRAARPSAVDLDRAADVVLVAAGGVRPALVGDDLVLVVRAVVAHRLASAAAAVDRPGRSVAPGVLRPACDEQLAGAPLRIAFHADGADAPAIGK